MGNFNRNNRGGGDRGGRPRFGGGRGGDRGGFRGGDRREGGRSEMHAATCSECGNACEVPFRPTGARPIFCSTCFGKQKSQDGKSFGGGSRERNFDRPRFENKRPDFRAAPVQDNKTLNELKQQMEIMNNKLERILKAVGTGFSEEKQPEKKKEEKTPKKSEEKKEVVSEKPKTKKAKAKKKK